MGIGSGLSDCARSIDAWVAEQQERSRARKANLVNNGSDPKELKKQLENQVKECVEMERGIERLQDAIKNAEPALAKLKSQAAKDEAALLDLVKSGGGEAITARAPFVVAMTAAIDPIGAKSRQAVGDIEQLIAQLHQDKTLQEALPRGRSDLPPIIKLLEEALEELKRMPSRVQAIKDALTDGAR